MTITVPHEHYTDRHDDEGRLFHALHTVTAAAGIWQAEDPKTRAWSWSGPAESPELVFVQVAEAPAIYQVSPDEDMEDLYPATRLPFTIAAGPYRPFAPGVYITLRKTILENPRVWRVDAYDEDGSLNLTGTTGMRRCQPGSITADRFAEYKEVPAPTVTYTVTVTVPWTDSAEDVGGTIEAALGHPVTVAQP